MANRAYLFCCDSSDPEDWDRNELSYFDSRWDIPLAWFFFYKIENIHVIDISYNNSNWKEVKLIAKKETALKLFYERYNKLLQIIDTFINNRKIFEFISTIQLWPGQFLILEPSEVFAGMSDDDDLLHAEKFKLIFEYIDSEVIEKEEFFNKVKSYCYLKERTQDLYELSIIGYTYDKS